MTTSSTELRTWGDIHKYPGDNCWKRQKSADDTIRRVRRITSYWGNSLPLRHLTKGHVWIELQNDLLDDFDLSNGRVNKIVSAASHAMRYTFNLDLHSHKRPAFEELDVDESRQAYFTKEQVVQLCSVAVEIYSNQNLADAMNVAAYTGIRQGELLRVRIRDIDQENNVMWIGGRPETSTKNRTGRPIPLNIKIQPLIDKRLQTKNPNGLLFGDEWLNKGQLYKQFVKCRKLIGLDQSYVWHSFRHSFCTWSGAVDHPRNIKAIAGHKSMDTTLKYCKVSNPALHNLVAKL